MRVSHRQTRVLLLVCLLAILTAGCNLSPTTPTPLPRPTATNVPALDLSQPPLTDATAIPPNPNCATTPAGWIPYVVEPGDSLSLLASQTDSSLQDLAAGNCLQNADQIEVGATLYVPIQPVVDSNS